MSWKCKNCSKRVKGCDFITNNHCFEKVRVKVLRSTKRLRVRVLWYENDTRFKFAYSTVYKQGTVFSLEYTQVFRSSL